MMESAVNVARHRGAHQLADGYYSPAVHSLQERELFMNVVEQQLKERGQLY